jgi:hypothetical protein
MLGQLQGNHKPWILQDGITDKDGNNEMPLGGNGWLLQTPNEICIPMSLTF